MFQLYRSGLLRREWRWRFRAANGEVVFASSESYREKRDAMRSIGIARGSGSAPVEELA